MRTSSVTSSSVRPSRSLPTRASSSVPRSSAVSPFGKVTRRSRRFGALRGGNSLSVSVAGTAATVEVGATLAVVSLLCWGIVKVPSIVSLRARARLGFLLRLFASDASPLASMWETHHDPGGPQPGALDWGRRNPATEMNPA